MSFKIIFLFRNRTSNFWVIECRSDYLQRCCLVCNVIVWKNERVTSVSNLLISKIYAHITNYTWWYKEWKYNVESNISEKHFCWFWTLPIFTIKDWRKYIYKIFWDLWILWSRDEIPFSLIQFWLCWPLLQWSTCILKGQETILEVGNFLPIKIFQSKLRKEDQILLPIFKKFPQKFEANKSCMLKIAGIFVELHIEK